MWSCGCEKGSWPEMHTGRDEFRHRLFPFYFWLDACPATCALSELFRFIIGISKFKRKLKSFLIACTRVSLSPVICGIPCTVAGDFSVRSACLLQIEWLIPWIEYHVVCLVLVIPYRRGSGRAQCGLSIPIFGIVLISLYWFLQNLMQLQYRIKPHTFCGYLICGFAHEPILASVCSLQ